MNKIDSLQNEKIKKMKMLKEKKGRATYGLFLAEGEKCVQEALLYSNGVKEVFMYGENHSIISLAKEYGAEVTLVSRPIIEALTSVQTPQNVVAALTVPEEKKPAGNFVIALDGVSDPQNVGSIIRSADASGAAGVVMSAGCADYLNPKAVRASMGSIFHLSLLTCSLAEYLIEFKKTGKVIAGHLNGGSEMPTYEKVCLVIGNEARGISEHIAELCDFTYKIPIYGKAESLNAAVAAGIMMYMAREKIERAKEEFRDEGKN